MGSIDNEGKLVHKTLFLLKKFLKDQGYDALIVGDVIKIFLFPISEEKFFNTRYIGTVFNRPDWIVAIVANRSSKRYEINLKDPGSLGRILELLTDKSYWE